MYFGDYLHFGYTVTLLISTLASWIWDYDNLVQTRKANDEQDLRPTSPRSAGIPILPRLFDFPRHDRLQVPGCVSCTSIAGIAGSSSVYSRRLENVPEGYRLSSHAEIIKALVRKA